MGKLEKLVNQFLATPPEVSFQDVEYVLEAFGFEEKRSRGSHHTFEDDQGRVIVVPKKGGKTVKRTYLKEIIKILNLEEWQGE
jgi:predicted RNA binding protein YcfA (HicA-like mRNA interferase family)